MVRAWRLALGVAMVCVVMAIDVPALGHAVLKSSNPADGAVLEAPPRRVVLVVTERPDPRLSSIEVLDDDSRDTVDGDLSVSSDGTEVSVRVKDNLAKGVYTVSWRVFSTVDGHITGGVLAFGVQVSPDEVTPQTQPDAVASGPTALEVGARILFYVGIVLLIGSSWVSAFAFADSAGLRWVPMVSVVAALIGALGLGAAQMQKSGGDIAAFIGSSIGRAAIWRAAALVLAVPALLVSRRRLLLLAAVGGGAAIFVNASAGHAAAPPAAWAKVGVQAIHFVAVAVWIGGLAALIIGLSSTTSGEVAVRRFSRVAGVAVFVVLAAGTFRAVNEVSRWGQLFTTGYGRIVLAKLGLFTAIGLFATTNRYRNIPIYGTDPARLVRSSRIELGLAGVVLLLTGLLASLVPAKVAADSGREPGVTVVGQDFARTVRAELIVSPGVPGANRFTLTASDPVTDEVVPAQGVALRLSPPAGEDAEASTIELRREGDRWVGRGNGLFIAGVWNVAALVRSGTDSVEVALVVPTTCDTRSTAVSGQPTLHDVDTSFGTAQGYLDPGRTGRNALHFTYFDEGGTELDLEEPFTVTAVRVDASSGDEPRVLAPRRLSSGHFVAPAEIESGRWRFDASAPTTDGQRVRACFEEGIT